MSETNAIKSGYFTRVNGHAEIYWLDGSRSWMPNEATAHTCLAGIDAIGVIDDLLTCIAAHMPEDRRKQHQTIINRAIDIVEFAGRPPKKSEAAITQGGAA